jgi:protein-tyrosine phosphatase
VEEGVDLLGRHFDQVPLLHTVTHLVLRLFVCHRTLPGSAVVAVERPVVEGQRTGTGDGHGWGRGTAHDGGPATSGQNGQVSDSNGAIQADDAVDGGERREHEHEHEDTGAGSGEGVFRVCFVCTGNICRSPMADGVFRRLAAETVLTDGTPMVERLDITSAGTGNWHAGEPMDPRARDVLAHRGYQDHGHVARAFETAWFDDSDLVVCLDRGHQQTLVSLARGRAGDDRYLDHLVMLRSFDPRAGGAVDVPDPYYGDDGDFEACLDLVEAGCRGLTAYLVDRAGPSGLRELERPRQVGDEGSDVE